MPGESVDAGHRSDACARHYRAPAGNGDPGHEQPDRGMNSGTMQAATDLEMDRGDSACARGGGKTARLHGQHAPSAPQSQNGAAKNRLADQGYPSRAMYLCQDAHQGVFMGVPRIRRHNIAHARVVQ